MRRAQPRNWDLVIDEYELMTIFGKRESDFVQHFMYCKPVDRLDIDTGS